MKIFIIDRLIKKINNNMRNLSKNYKNRKKGNTGIYIHFNQQKYLKHIKSKNIFIILKILKFIKYL